MYNVKKKHRTPLTWLCLLSICAWHTATCSRLSLSSNFHKLGFYLIKWSQSYTFPFDTSCKKLEDQDTWCSEEEDPPHSAFLYSSGCRQTLRSLFSKAFLFHPHNPLPVPTGQLTPAAWPCHSLWEDGCRWPENRLPLSSFRGLTSDYKVLQQDSQLRSCTAHWDDPPSLPWWLSPEGSMSHTWYGFQVPLWQCTCHITLNSRHQGL